MSLEQQQAQQQSQTAEVDIEQCCSASMSRLQVSSSGSSDSGTLKSPVVKIQEPAHNADDCQEERLRKSRSRSHSGRRSSSTLASKSSRRSSGCSSRSISSDRSSTTASTSSLSAKSCAHSTCVLAEPCRRMIELSGLPSTSTKPLMILDNACGGSALATFSIFDALPPILIEETQIIAMDINQNAVAAATHRLSESEWSDRVMTLKMDMQHIDGLGQKEFDYVFTNFSINLAKDVASTLKGLHRTLKPNGTFAFTVWHRLEWIDILRQAIKQEISEAPAFPDSETCLFHFSNFNAWHDPDWVRSKLSEHDFTSVEVQVMPTKHRFTKEEFMDNFGGCVVAYLTKCAWGQKAAEKYKEKISVALEKYLSAKGEDGLELELDALVVAAKKGDKDSPSAL